MILHLGCQSRPSIGAKLPEILIDHGDFLIDFIRSVVQLNPIRTENCRLDVPPPVELRKVVLLMLYGIQKRVNLSHWACEFRSLENTTAIPPIPLGKLIWLSFLFRKHEKCSVVSSQFLSFLPTSYTWNRSRSLLLLKLLELSELDCW